MNLVITTSLMPHAKVRSLVKFVFGCRDHLKFQRNIRRLTVEDCPSGSRRQVGLTRKTGSGTEVDVWVRLSPELYPFSERLNLRTPIMTYDNAAEEFVAILGHELTHVRQYATSRPITAKTLMEVEVEAEYGGATDLDSYRAAIRKFVQAA